MTEGSALALQRSKSKHTTYLRVGVDEPIEMVRLIAIILLGQAEHAAEILLRLVPHSPIVREDLIDNALRSIALDHSTKQKLDSSRWRRDGLLFECISWLSCRLESHEGERLSTMPHLKSTTQGVDGLVLDWVAEENRVARATILEDKCSEHPRSTFRTEVMPAFTSHHNGERSTELLSVASTLIRQTGSSGIAAVEAASAALDTSLRAYRAGLAVTDKHDSEEARAKLFKGFEQLKGLKRESRVGVTLVVDDPDLRAWFDSIAGLVSAEIRALWEEEERV